MNIWRFISELVAFTILFAAMLLAYVVFGDARASALCEAGGIAWHAQFGAPKAPRGREGRIVTGINIRTRESPYVLNTVELPWQVPVDHVAVLTYWAIEARLAHDDDVRLNVAPVFSDVPLMKDQIANKDANGVEFLAEDGTAARVGQYQACYGFRETKKCDFSPGIAVDELTWINVRVVNVEGTTAAHAGTMGGCLYHRNQYPILP